MSISEATFHELVDQTQRQIEDLLEATNLDFDLENSGGILTIICENQSQVIISRQAPLKQLWVAARSGGFHFDYDNEQQQWLDSSSAQPLAERLQAVFSEQAGESLDFSSL